MTQFIALILSAVSFFSTLYGVLPLGRTYTVTLDTVERAGYEWSCEIDDDRIIRLKSLTEADGEDGKTSCEFVLRAVMYCYGCARAEFSYSDGETAEKYVYTFKVNGTPVFGTFALLMTEVYPEGTPVSKSNAEILSQYSDVMNRAKLTAKTYSSTVYTDVDWTISVPGTSLTFKPGTNVLEDDGTLIGMTQFPIMYSVGCSLTDATKIKSASYENLSDGNARIVLTLFDEDGDEKYIHKLFNVPNGGLFELPVAEQFNIKDFACKYFDCTAVLVFDPDTGNIVSLEHIIGYGINGTVSFAGAECSIVGRPVDHERYDDFTF